jgi:Na+/melibiose symporter-like transporter
MKATDAAKRLTNDVKKHWREPPENRFIPYREFAAYSVGGIGISAISSLFTYVALTANCILIGSVFNIKPTHLAYMGVLMGIINIVKTPFVSMLVDNTNTKHGKFRPYLVYMGLPCAALLSAVPFIPVNAAYISKCLIIGVLYALLMLFQNLYAMAFSSLAQVMTPDGNERTRLLSISALIYNLGPTIINVLLPVAAPLISENGLRDITVYRIIFPVISVLGFLLGLWTFRGTKEKLIVPKNYVAEVSFKDGIAQAAKNKYFWLINIFTVLGSLKYGVGSTLAWFCIYALKKDAVLGVMNAVIGTASVPGMLLAPVLARKLGKKRSLILGNVIHGIFALPMMFSGDNPVLFFACLYMSTLGLGGEYVLTQSATADIYDYQQWKTGKRIEGFINQFGTMFTTICGLGIGLILPFFYERFGLLDDYNVLFDTSVRTPIFNLLIISTVISTAAAVIPLLFYDLSEKKHDVIIKELKERAGIGDGE